MKGKVLVKLVAGLTVMGVLSTACPVFAEEAASTVTSVAGEAESFDHGRSGSARDESILAPNGAADSKTDGIASGNAGLVENDTSEQGSSEEGSSGDHQPRRGPADPR